MIQKELPSLKQTIQDELQLPNGFIDNALKKAHRLVKRFKLPKKKGGYRIIEHPAAELKCLQYWLINNVFLDMPVHDAASAYRKGMSIRANAEKHKGHRYFLRIDLKDFFPSIQAKDILPLVRKHHRDKQMRWDLNHEAEALIVMSCFDSIGKLPIGYPSSPHISNVVMHGFDTTIEQALTALEFAVTYTRYADDMIFSTDQKGGCKVLEKMVSRIIKNSKSPKITINSEKTAYMSSSGGSAYVTGLRISHDDNVTLHRKYKDHVRLLLSLHKKKGLQASEISELRGHLAYIRGADPRFFTKLQNNYLDVIDSLM